MIDFLRSLVAGIIIVGLIDVLARFIEGKYVTFPEGFRLPEVTLAVALIVVITLFIWPRKKEEEFGFN